MQNSCLKMAIKLTIVSLPGMFMLAIVLFYYVHAQNNIPDTNPDSGSFTRHPGMAAAVCPIGMMKCSIKSNSLYQIRSKHKGFVCVESTLICDGKIDCFNGEDEQNCPTKDSDDKFGKFVLYGPSFYN